MPQGNVKVPKTAVTIMVPLLLVEKVVKLRFGVDTNKNLSKYFEQLAEVDIATIEALKIPPTVTAVAFRDEYDSDFDEDAVHKRGVSPEEIAEMQKLRDEGVPIEAIATRHGCGESKVRRLTVKRKVANVQA